MKYFLLSVLTFISILPAMAQTGGSVPLQIGESKRFFSSVLNEERTVNIYLPNQYDSSKAYPVVYLLDGSFNEDFLHVVGLMQYFNLQFSMPPFIVVGIANVDRKRDFTFHTSNEKLQQAYPTTGHSEKFMQFVEEELLPMIKSSYRTTSEKWLFGQSLGGLMATEFLLKKPELFTHYFIVSPSLWWDDESLLKAAPKLLAQHTQSPAFVYVAVGKQEPAVMQKDAKELFGILQQAYKNAVQKLHYNLMEAENHATILHNALYQGINILYPYKAQ